MEGRHHPHHSGKRPINRSPSVTDIARWRLFQFVCARCGVILRNVYSFWYVFEKREPVLGNTNNCRHIIGDIISEPILGTRLVHAIRYRQERIISTERTSWENFGKNSLICNINPANIWCIRDYRSRPFECINFNVTICTGFQNFLTVNDLFIFLKNW